MTCSRPSEPVLVIGPSLTVDEHLNGFLRARFPDRWCTQCLDCGETYTGSEILPVPGVAKMRQSKGRATENYL